MRLVERISPRIEGRFGPKAVAQAAQFVTSIKTYCHPNVQTGWAHGQQKLVTSSAKCRPGGGGSEQSAGETQLGSSRPENFCKGAV
jgi:hypothetical protein